MKRNIHPEEHLTPQQLDEWVWDRIALPSAAAAHLTGCAHCRQELAAREQLAADLLVIRRSQPSAEALEHYQTLFDERQEAASAWRDLVSWVAAALRWDSRQQPALAGVRRAGTRSYRIIYSAPTADIELWIVPQATTCSIEGDCILSGEGRNQEGPLVQLLATNNDAFAIETTASSEGRFQFAHVPAGVYDLWITPHVGQSVVIERLALP